MGFERPKLGPSGWAHAGPKWVGPSWAHVVGPKPGPSGWAQAGPTWVGPSQAQVGGPRMHRFGPLGIEVEKQGFRTVRLITGQKFPKENLKSGSSLLTFRDLSSHICEIIVWMATSGILDPGKTGFFKTHLFAFFFFFEK